MKVKETAKKPYGICPASMTIWNADQTYNKKGMEKYLTWLLDNGAQSISICGSTGENVAMNMEEQREIIGHVASFLNGQVPLICGTGRYDTLNTIKMSKYAQDCGADGVMVILPYYLNPHKKAVMQHFRDIRAALDIRMMIYNNPWFAGYEMTVPEIEELVNDGTIQDIKAAHGDPNRVHELKFHLGDKLNVFYGHDYCALEGLLVGADGWLSGLPGIFPKFCVDLFNLCTVQQDAPAARKLWDKMQDFIDYFITYSNNDPHWHEVFKYVLKCFGFNAGLPRMPLGDLLPEEKKKVDALLADMDVTIKATNLIK